MNASRFFLAASSGFLCGLACGLFLPVSAWGIGLFVSAFLMGSACLFFPRQLPSFLWLVFWLTAGAIYAESQVAFWSETGAFSLRNGEVSVMGFPQEKAFYREVRLEILSCGREICPAEVAKKGVLWQAPLGETAIPGEHFIFSCELGPIENFDEAFDYRFFLAKEGIGFLCKKGEKGEGLSGRKKDLFASSLFRVRQSVEKTLSDVFPEPEAGLAKGLLLGGGSFLGHDLEEDFRRIGMTHIVAVSGYNILLVAGFFLYGGNALGLWRRQTLFFAFGGIALFVCLVGAPASALRAGIMAAAAFLALATGRIGSWFTGVLLALVCMLAENPLLLRYDIGFQLSFLAVLGITVSSWEDEFAFLQLGSWRGAVFQAVKTTFWVELFVLPLILYHFGTVAWFSLPANILLLPLVPLAMLASFLAICLGFLLPASLSAFWSWPAYTLLFVLTRFAEYFGSFPLIAFEGLRIGPGLLALWYALLILFSFFRLIRKERAWYAKAFLSAA